jgi:hypothetical protein
LISKNFSLGKLNEARHRKYLKAVTGMKQINGGRIFTRRQEPTISNLTKSIETDPEVSPQNINKKQCIAGQNLG